MNIEDLLVTNSGTKKKHYSADQIIAVLDGAGGGGTARLTMTATYQTPSVSPTIYYTGLHTDGSVLSSRSTSGVTLGSGLYQKTQDTTGITDFIAVWDEGDVNDYTLEWIVVDT